MIQSMSKSVLTIPPGGDIVLGQVTVVIQNGDGK